MMNIKEILRALREDKKRVDFTDVELKCVSIKLLYTKLKNEHNIKKIRRMKLLFHFYPSLLENMSFKSIEKCINEPSDFIFTVSDKRVTMYPHEKYAIEKRCSGINPYYPVTSPIRSFYAIHFFEYFGV